MDIIDRTPQRTVTITLTTHERDVLCCAIDALNGTDEQDKKDLMEAKTLLGVLANVSKRLKAAEVVAERR